MEDNFQKFLSAEIIPASFLVYRELLFTASHGVKKPPTFFAEKYNLFVERSFEDGLGYYDFVGFQKGAFYFGLRMLTQGPKTDYSFVSVLGAPEDQKKHLISRALEIHLDDIFEFDHDN